MEKVFYFPKNFVCPEKIFEPLKWYTDRNFFGDGGGEPKEMCSTKNYFGTSRAQSKKVGQIYFRPPNFFLPVRPWVCSCCHETIHSLRPCVCVFLVQFLENMYLHGRLCVCRTSRFWELRRVFLRETFVLTCTRSACDKQHSMEKVRVCILFVRTSSISMQK